MRAFEQPEELMREVDECKTHVINRAIFWPRRWREFNPPKSISWSWKSVPFERNARVQVPNNKHGIYSFVLTTKVARHPNSCLLLYIGKADRMTLRERFISYFEDMQRNKRPPICYHLIKYRGFINFCFIIVEKQRAITAGEKALLNALLPPCNTAFPAEVSQIIRGLR